MVLSLNIEEYEYGMALNFFLPFRIKQLNCICLVLQMVYMVKAYGTKINGWYLRNLRTIVTVGTNSRAYSIFNLNMEHSRHLYSLRSLDRIPISVVAIFVVGNMGKNKLLIRLCLQVLKP